MSELRLLASVGNRVRSGLLRLLCCTIASIFLLSHVDRAVGQTRNDSINYSKSGEIVLEKLNDPKNDTVIRFSPGMKEKVEEYGVQNMLNYYREKLGLIKSFSGPQIYAGTAKFQITAEKGRWSMIVGFDSEGLVSSLRFADPDPVIPVPKRNATPMRLPFRGEWSVEEGGPTVKQNYHAGVGNHQDIRWAVDFGVRDAEGKPYRADGNKNEDYYAFGKEILAVADGEVVTVYDGVSDNRPDTDNPLSSAGNLIIIEHANHEYSRYAHLKMNSISVKVGQKVVSGQVIGQCGNSGSTLLPHLHFDLTNTDVASDATGFPLYFENVIVKRDGTTSTPASYTPLQDDRVQSRH